MSSSAWWGAGPFTSGGETEGELRRHAGRILAAGIRAADPQAAVSAALERRATPIESARRIFIVALGKAADAMVRGALPMLGDVLAGGVVVGPTGGDPQHDRLVRLCGDHPIPGPASLSAGEAVRALAGTVSAGDLVVCLISGGASALATLPVTGVTLADMAGMTDALLRAGANIGEVNTVRRRLDRLKGGRLAGLLAPAHVIGLLVSDVPGDRVHDIASGPLVPDPTGGAEALGVLRARGLADGLPPGVTRALLDDTRVAAERHVDLEIVASARHALAGAAAEAGGLGYAVDADPGHVAGEARSFGRELTAQILAARGSRAVLRAGETTVTVRGTGRGGRNQEVALGAVAPLAGHGQGLVAAMGTDGIDGPTDAAGAVATTSTAGRAEAIGLDAVAALANNDAYSFFEPLGDLIRSGPTGTNVMDLYIALAR